MAYAIPLVCPACAQQMAVTELTCENCNTRVQGVFQSPGLHRLNMEQLQFVEVFLRCRGNIKEVERDLKISYPTVRSRLDQIIQAMGYAESGPDEFDLRAQVHEPTPSPSNVLDALGAGELTFDDALQRIKESGNRTQP